MSSGTYRHEDDSEILQRRIRLVGLLHAAENAGLAPMPVRLLHTFAYLSNSLAPVWDMPVLDGKLLKRQGGAFYPSLQRDLDRMVGMGVVLVSDLAHVMDEENRWRLDGSYRLNEQFAEPILQCLRRLEEERVFLDFLLELAFALSALSDPEIEKAVMEDANYSDPMIDFGNVVDFAEWQRRNYTAKAAAEFKFLLPGGARANPGEELHLYVRHLYARMHGGH